MVLIISPEYVQQASNYCDHHPTEMEALGSCGKGNSISLSLAFDTA